MRTARPSIHLALSWHGGRLVVVSSDDSAAARSVVDVWVSLASGWIVSHRSSVLARRGVTGFVTFLLWMLLWVATTAVCATVGNSLPGVVPFEPSRTLLLLVIGLGMPPAAMTAVMLNLIAPARLRGGRCVRWVAARGWFLLVRLLRDVLGLVTSRWRAVLAVTAGVIAGLASVGAGYLLRTFPALVATAPATDARFDAVASSAQ